jgi:monoterpene epsilon-lactone hydrolase
MASDEMHAILEIMNGRKPDGGPVEQRRENLEATTGFLEPPEGTEIEYIELADCGAEWIHGPGSTDDGAIVYLHGGGYCLGSIGTHRSLASRLSVAAGLPVLIVGYRLAPEHPQPAAVDDAVAAYRWLLDQGFAPAQLAIAGDSAGGGLALAAMLQLRATDPGLVPGAGALLSPWTDLTQSGASLVTNADRDQLLSAATLQELADWYLNGVDPRDPLVSPRFADLAGLPPLLIQVGEPEALLDDATGTAAAAEAAGVAVTLDVWPEMFHVWQASAGLTPEGDRAMEAIGAFLARHVIPR